MIYRLAVKSKYQKFVPLIMALHGQKYDVVQIRRQCEITGELTSDPPPATGMIHYIIRQKGYKPHKADKSWKTRNQAILDENEKGVGYKRLARKYDLNKSRIQQIVKAAKAKRDEKELT